MCLVALLKNMALPSSALKKVQDASKTIIAQKWNCCSSTWKQFPAVSFVGLHECSKLCKLDLITK